MTLKNADLSQKDLPSLLKNFYGCKEKLLKIPTNVIVKKNFQFKSNMN
jgi:hypothetical protein